MDPILLNEKIILINKYQKYVFKYLNNNLLEHILNIGSNYSFQN